MALNLGNGVSIKSTTAATPYDGSGAHTFLSMFEVTTQSGTNTVELLHTAAVAAPIGIQWTTASLMRFIINTSGGQKFTPDAGVTLSPNTKYAVACIFDGSLDGQAGVEGRVWSFDGTTATLVASGDASSSLGTAPHTITEASNQDLFFNGGTNGAQRLFGFGAWAEVLTEAELKSIVEAGDPALRATNLTHDLWYEDAGKTAGNYVNGDLTIQDWGDIIINAGTPTWDATEWLTGGGGGDPEAALIGGKLLNGGLLTGSRLVR